MDGGSSLIEFVVKLLLWLLTITASAQTNTGDVSGVVRDAQGGVLPGALVVATHIDSGIAVERVTDAEGRYLLPSLRIGAYTVTAELAGFRRVIRSGVTLQLGQSAVLDFVLEVGGVTEDIIVTGQRNCFKRRQPKSAT